MIGNRKSKGLPITPVENTTIMLLVSTQFTYSPDHVQEILWYDTDPHVSNIEVVCFLASLEERVTLQFTNKKSLLPQVTADWKDEPQEPTYDHFKSFIYFS